MTHDNALLKLAEQNAQNLSALAGVLGAELDEDLTPSGTSKDAARLFGLPTQGETKDASMNESERTAALLKQNAANLQRLLEATDVDTWDIAGDDTDVEKAAFMGLK